MMITTGYLSDQRIAVFNHCTYRGFGLTLGYCFIHFVKQPCHFITTLFATLSMFFGLPVLLPNFNQQYHYKGHSNEIGKDVSKLDIFQPGKLVGIGHEGNHQQGKNHHHPQGTTKSAGALTIWITITSTARHHYLHCIAVNKKQI